MNAIDMRKLKGFNLNVKFNLLKIIKCSKIKS